MNPVFRALDWMADHPNGSGWIQMVGVAVSCGLAFAMSGWLMALLVLVGWSGGVMGGAALAVSIWEKND